MFGIVPLSVHILALERLASEQTQREMFERQKTIDDTSIRWLCARINHLEKTNAVLFHAVTNLNVPVPEVTTAPAAPASSDIRPFGSNPFEDMGDDEARRQGVGWDLEGRVKYQDQPKP